MHLWKMVKQLEDKEEALCDAFFMTEENFTAHHNKNQNGELDCHSSPSPTVGSLVKDD